MHLAHPAGRRSARSSGARAKKAHPHAQQRVQSRGCSGTKAQQYAHSLTDARDVRLQRHLVHLDARPTRYHSRCPTGCALCASPNLPFTTTPVHFHCTDTRTKTCPSVLRPPAFTPLASQFSFPPSTPNSSTACCTEHPGLERRKGVVETVTCPLIFVWGLGNGSK
jgi:hypothetical protein